MTSNLGQMHPRHCPRRRVVRRVEGYLMGGCAELGRSSSIASDEIIHLRGVDGEQIEEIPTDSCSTGSARRLHAQQSRWSSRKRRSSCSRQAGFRTGVRRGPTCAARSSGSWRKELAGWCSDGEARAGRRGTSMPEKGKLRVDVPAGRGDRIAAPRGRGARLGVGRGTPCEIA